MHHHKQNRYVSISFVLFLVILSYIIYHIVVFASAENYTATVVEPGKLVNSQSFRALIIRDEKVYKAEDDGSLRMFLNEGERARAGTEVAGIIADSEEIRLLEEEIEGASEDLSIDTELSDEVLNVMRKSFRNFTVNNNYKGLKYTDSYSRKLNFDLGIIREEYLLANSKYSDEYLRLKQKYNEKISFLRTDKSGILSFAIDGKEGLNLENLDFDYLSDLPDDLEVHYKNELKSGDVVFKIIPDYLWYIALEIDDVCEKEIEDLAYVDLLLGKEKEKIYARVYKVENRGDKTYLILELDRLLNNFLDRRIVDVEIVHRDYEGLKIPSKAIVDKPFVKIPSDYLQYVNGENVVLINSDENILKTHKIDIFKEDGEYIWIAKSEIIDTGKTVYLGDLKSKKNKEYKIEESTEMQGVYVINKGYAEYRFIEHIYDEDGFIIIRDNTAYGVRIYDRIITDSKMAKEDMIVNR